jgi:hypothetical protein
VIALIDDSTSLTLGNLQQMLKDQETRFGKEGGQLRQAVHAELKHIVCAVGIRLFWDRLQEAADPQAHVMAADHAGCQAKLWARVLVEGRGAGAGESAGSRGGCGTLRSHSEGKRLRRIKNLFLNTLKPKRARRNMGMAAQPKRYKNIGV